MRSSPNACAALGAAVLGAVLAACSQPAPAPQSPTPTHGAAAVDAAPSDDEKLAAIQKAMNELDEAAQGCWAVAATDRFDVAGELTVMVDIAATTAKTQVMADTARNAKLSGCVA